MSSSTKSSALNWLIHAYFSKSEQSINLKKGEKLLEQGTFNDRLFLIRRGILTGHVTTPAGQQQEIFEAHKNMFVGVYSFFSRTFSSSATVIADQDSEVSYIDWGHPFQDDGQSTTMFEQFMPVVMLDLSQRWQREQTVVAEKERALKNLIHAEKLASLGQMAAGIAHELNNAVSVLARNSDWICQQLTHFLDKENKLLQQFFESGLQFGRALSSREVRKKSRDFEKKFNLSGDQARMLAETGISRSELKDNQSELLAAIEDIHNHWQLGTAFHDMEVAARHATHVVKSVKNLASQGSERQPGFDVGESITEALTLLSSPLRKVEVKLKLNEMPAITANKGELVQIWMNLFKNAVEAMVKAQTKLPRLQISSKCDAEMITVYVQDNGPGIPKDYLERIFQPNFTTKESGLEFGLGLGLSIVEQIVHNYGGNITVTSRPGKTVFTVKLRISALSI